MKRKLTLGIVAMLFLLTQAWAQGKTVSGTVTSSDATPLIGVTVLVKSSTSGTITDIDGKYAVEVAEGAVLVFSYTGFETQEVSVGAQSMVNVTLAEGVSLDEVVVTALGISRSKKALGYAVQEVDGSELTTGSEANFVNTLGGRVAGVQIQGAQGIGGSSRILIRGANSLLGENQPLFVVDGIPIDNSNYGGFRQQYGSRDDSRGNRDYGNAAQDINPNDIESVSVLKGAMAAALYGSRGSNGVILITTKKGKAGKAKIELSVGATVDKAWDFPPLQNLYGGGNTAEFTIGADGIPEMNVTTDESWGPKLDGQMVRQWDGNGQGGEVRPWVAHPTNYEDFFETGITSNMNVAVSGGTEKTQYRLSFTNRDQTGITPNSSLKNKAISLNLGSELSDKLSVSTTINYYNRQGQGRPSGGGSSDNYTYNLVIWTQRQLDIERLRNYENPDGSQRTWRTNGFDRTNVRANNPFWLAYKDVQTDNKDRLIGNVSATYKFTDHLNLMVRAGQDWYVDNRNDVRAVGSRYTPFYINDNINYRQENYDALATYSNNFDDLSFNVSLGTSLLKETRRQIRSHTNGGLNLAGIYTLGNSVDPSTVSTILRNKEIQSVYASASFGYKNFLYVDVMGRNDWSSALPSENNSYFYPAVTGSLVFSELMSSDKVSFGKVRLGWGQVGKDTGPYNILQTYSNGLAVGGDPVFRLPSSLKNPTLKPEITTSIEAGLEMKFLNNRIGFDFTAYSSNSKDQIIPITVSPTTGFSSRFVNAGELENKGVELSLDLAAVQKSDFNWDIRVNWGKNTSKVVSLPEGIKSILHATFYASGPARVFLESRIGQPFNSIYATQIAEDDNGNPIVRGPNSSNPGTWLPADTAAFFGSVQPNWTAGLSNTFRYKNLSLSVLLDMQDGGVIFLRGYQTALYAGTMLETAENGIRENGIVLDGVWEDGTPNNINLDAKNYNRLKRRTPGVHTVFDASFIKLREVSLSYHIPMAGNKYISSANLSLVGRNLAILKRNTPDGYDPESAGNTSGNLQGREYGQYPGARSIGFNLSLGF